jgi:hypothetical protein
MFHIHLSMTVIGPAKRIYMYVCMYVMVLHLTRSNQCQNNVCRCVARRSCSYVKMHTKASKGGENCITKGLISFNFRGRVINSSCGWLVGWLAAGSPQRRPDLDDSPIHVIHGVQGGSGRGYSRGTSVSMSASLHQVSKVMRPSITEATVHKVIQWYAVVNVLRYKSESLWLRAHYSISHARDESEYFY